MNWLQSFPSTYSYLELGINLNKVHLIFCLRGIFECRSFSILVSVLEDAGDSILVRCVLNTLAPRFMKFDTYVDNFMMF